MSQRVDELKQSVNQSLSDSTKPWKAAFDFVEEKTGVPRLYLFSGKFEYGSFSSLAYVADSHCDDVITVAFHNAEKILPGSVLHLTGTYFQGRIPRESHIYLIVKFGIVIIYGSFITCFFAITIYI